MRGRGYFSFLQWLNLFETLRFRPRTPVADVTSPEPTVSFESQTTAVEAEMAEAA